MPYGPRNTLATRPRPHIRRWLIKRRGGKQRTLSRRPAVKAGGRAPEARVEAETRSPPPRRRRWPGAGRAETELTLRRQRTSLGQRRTSPSGAGRWRLGAELTGRWRQGRGEETNLCFVEALPASGVSPELGAEARGEETDLARRGSGPRFVGGDGSWR
ncbi:hypothetical protein NL676_039888 [Syzygium grande]|nr:hypothetical protein NL676_039888 [Syzygium grande]